MFGYPLSFLYVIFSPSFLLLIIVPRYVPEDQRELQSICERVSPRLQHVNAAVVLSAVKVIMKLLAAMADEDYKTALLAKLAPPLVTLLSSEPEIQCVLVLSSLCVLLLRPLGLTQMNVIILRSLESSPSGPRSRS